jgi:hypothetical protein
MPINKMAMMGRFTSYLYDEIPAKTQTPKFTCAEVTSLKSPLPTHPARSGPKD